MIYRHLFYYIFEHIQLTVLCFVTNFCDSRIISLQQELIKSFNSFDLIDKNILKNNIPFRKLQV